ncbi:MAG: hypothetical protein EXS13_01700 [Planctomycetes bacterium]|nr:hypothetical protein [Planctomycetota bacterium]
MDLSLVNHLFVTPRFVVKGTVRSGALRLSSFLNAARRPWLTIDEVTFTDLESGEKISARRATLRLADVLFAHEFLDLGGDPVRRKLAQSETPDFRMVSAWFRAPARLEIVGRARREALDPAATDDFFVLLEPLLRGIVPSQAAALEPCKNLSYAIVQRSQLHGYFEYE